MNNLSYLGDLTIMKQIGIKPNFSELSRIYHVDRHTIAKHYREGGVNSKVKQVYHNYLENYRDEIIEKLNMVLCQDLGQLKSMFLNYVVTFNQYSFSYCAGDS